MGLPGLIRRVFAAGVVAGLASACDAVSPSGPAAAPPAPELRAPSQSPDLTARAFEAVDEAVDITGDLSVSETYRLAPEQGEASGPASGATVLSLRSANGHSLEAELVAPIDAGAEINGLSVRTIMALPADAVPALFRVSSETSLADAVGLCGVRPATHIVTWEPPTGMDPTLKILVTTGDAPGEGGAVLCQVLAYRRGGA